MVPMRTSTIFKSRWMALIWAAGIIWFAYDFAGSASPSDTGNAATNDASGTPASSDETNKVAQILGN